jgi:N-acetylmuramoyl-L-alanine amidase
LKNPEIISVPLPYTKHLAHRSRAGIDLVVIHCTELPDLATAREYGERVHYPESGTGNSGHFYIEQNGSIEQWVPLDRVANHVKGFNDRSIGIELVNRGRYPDWYDSRHQQMPEAYPPAQIENLVRLLDWLTGELSGLRWVAGHEDLDTGMVAASDDPALLVQRKRDPGPRFPWTLLLEAVRLERMAAKQAHSSDRNY